MRVAMHLYICMPKAYVGYVSLPPVKVFNKNAVYTSRKMIDRGCS